MSNAIEVPPANVEAPHGTEPGDWQHIDGTAFRLLYEVSRTIPQRPDIIVQATAVQMGDGGIDSGSIEPPAVHVEVGDDPLTVEQARRLAAEILAAADYVAALAPDPAHPLDRFSLAAIVEHVARRISGPGALRHVLANTVPADLTPDDRDTMLELIQQSERLEFQAMMARRAQMNRDID
jgi:hypothetical protein